MTKNSDFCNELYTAQHSVLCIRSEKTVQVPEKCISENTCSSGVKQHVYSRKNQVQLMLTQNYI